MINNGVIMTDFKKIYKHLFCITFGVLLGFVIGFYTDNMLAVQTEQDEIHNSDFSVAITEREELIFINRTSGNFTLIDTTLTQVIDRLFARKHYLKTNEIR